ncbi:MAG TPA: hypothetical protein VEK07_17970 [Polyangiaceae bacterium]|nr:hypothetical protein [Polyangiaceae bacterium]
MRGPITIAVILCGATSGCRGAPAGSSGADASGKTALGTDAGSPTHRPSPLPRKPTDDGAACRAIAVDGDVGRGESVSLAALDGGGARLATLDPVPDGTWISLGSSARVVLKDAHGVRETTFLGPGRARGCVGRQGESWLAAGRFEGLMGGSEPPSAEQWVVTPLGVFRYVSAKIDIDVTPSATTASIAGGTCFLWNADDSHVEKKGERRDAGTMGAADTMDAPWERLSAGEVRILPVPGGSTGLGAKRATDTCLLRAARAEELARALLVRDAGQLPTGETIAEQVRARRLAHASCSMARLRVDILASTEGRGVTDSFTKALNEADNAWSRVPLR